MFTLFGAVSARLRETGALPPLPVAPAVARSSFHLGVSDAALRALAARCGFTGGQGPVSWHVPCVWPRQSGATFAAAFTSCQPVCRAALDALETDDKRSLVVRRCCWRGRSCTHSPIIFICLPPWLSSCSRLAPCRHLFCWAQLNELAMKADELLANGTPIACDVVVVLARKPGH